jgi:hypothetical protein
LEEALKKYDMGDDKTIKDIINEVDTDHVSISYKHQNHSTPNPLVGIGKFDMCLQCAHVDFFQHAVISFVLISSIYIVMYVHTFN